MTNLDLRAVGTVDERLTMIIERLDLDRLIASADTSYEREIDEAYERGYRAAMEFAA
jgi:hypothetical protein